MMHAHTLTQPLTDGMLLSTDCLLLDHVSTAVVDDFAIWKRALTANEAAALATATTELGPKPTVSFTSVTLQRSGAGREAGAVQVRN